MGRKFSQIFSFFRGVPHKKPNWGGIPRRNYSVCLKPIFFWSGFSFLTLLNSNFLNFQFFYFRAAFPLNCRRVCMVAHPFGAPSFQKFQSLGKSFNPHFRKGGFPFPPPGKKKPLFQGGILWMIGARGKPHIPKFPIWLFFVWSSINSFLFFPPFFSPPFRGLGGLPGAVSFI